ncbi:hypothetical protein B1745_01015 [Lactobacillus amylolyticus]|nr:hypothetical protein B1745_01015 [Lactobacillus amylolyticus]
MHFLLEAFITPFTIVLLLKIFSHSVEIIIWARL